MDCKFPVRGGSFDGDNPEHAGKRHAGQCGLYIGVSSANIKPQHRLGIVHRVLEMKPSLKLLGLFLLLAASAFANQDAFHDDFGGLLSVPCSAHPHALTFTTGSQSGTTQTLTVTGAATASTWQANHAYGFGSWVLDAGLHWQKAIVAGTSGNSLPTFNDSGNATSDNAVEWQDWGPAVAKDEPFKISGTSTAMDWAFTSNTDAQAGTSYVASVNLGTGVVTLTATASHPVAGPVSGTLTPAHPYFATVATPFGSGPQQCSPEGNWWFQQSITGAKACVNNPCLGSSSPLDAVFASKYNSNSCTMEAAELLLFQS